LMSSDPELGEPDRRERLDPREPAAEAIVAAARAGEPVSDRLARLGVRWVLVFHAVDWQEVRGVGDADPGLRPALRAPTLDLWEVRSWPGAGTAPADGVVEPLLAPASGTTAVARPAAR